MLGMLACSGRQRRKEILLLYKIAHKGRTEWKGTVFDIRRRYLREFHEKLDALYAGIELYARYRKRTGEDEVTQRISLSQHQKKAIDWENNSSVRIRSICYEWSADEKQVRLEYRRTPAQVYAARFLQTKGIGAEDYEHLNTLLVEEEWKIRPRFAWVCQLGIGSIAAIVFVLSAAIFWGGPSAFLDSEIGTILPNRAPAVIQATVAHAVLLIVTIMILFSLKAYVFPAGVIRIDEEEVVQRKRESLQKWFFRSMLLAIAIILTQQVANYLNEVCKALPEDVNTNTEGILVQYIRGSSLCKILEITRVVQ